MARQLAGVAKQHPPRQRRAAAPELAVDEITHAPRGDAERHQRRHEVHQAQIIDAMAPRGEAHREHHAKQPAVERHASLPHGEDLQRMARVVPGLVEQHVAQAPAENHAEHREKQEIVELRARHGREALADAPQAEPPAGGEAEQVHEAVPAHREGPHGKSDRIDVRMDQHG